MQIEQIQDHPDFRRLNEIAGIAVDLRYAGPNNFVSRSIYGNWDCAWLHKDAAVGLVKVVDRLSQQKVPVTLLVLDALRPHRAQQVLWKQLEGTELQLYLADPERGSIHSYGMAVDVTLLDASGRELDMGTGFDEMTPLSHPKLEQLHLSQGMISATQLANRQLLRSAMLQSGFLGISTEWWHFDFGDRASVRADHDRID